jgi:preprotein translocase subunit SecB
MADTNSKNDGQNGPAAAPAPAVGNQPNLSVVAQYVKDLSFENPGAPGTLRPRQNPPTINVSVGVQPTQTTQGGDIEVELKIEARGNDGDTVLFVLELVYAGLFRLTNIPAQDVAPITLIECPRLLFPFARQIVSDASRNGGFPPLLIDPIDFVSLYRQRLAVQQGAAPGAQTPPVGNA